MLPFCRMHLLLLVCRVNNIQHIVFMPIQPKWTKCVNYRWNTSIYFLSLLLHFAQYTKINDDRKPDFNIVWAHHHRYQNRCENEMHSISPNELDKTRFSLWPIGKLPFLGILFIFAVLSSWKAVIRKRSYAFNRRTLKFSSVVTQAWARHTRIQRVIDCAVGVSACATYVLLDDAVDVDRHAVMFSFHMHTDANVGRSESASAGVHKFTRSDAYLSVPTEFSDGSQLFGIATLNLWGLFTKGVPMYYTIHFGSGCMSFHVSVYYIYSCACVSVVVRIYNAMATTIICCTNSLSLGFYGNQ